MEINYENIIENDFEKPIYQNLQKKIVEFLHINNNCSFWDIVRHVGGSERRTIRLLREMKNAGQIKVQNDTFSIDGGHQYFSVCPTCDGKLCVCNQSLANKLKNLNKYTIKNHLQHLFLTNVQSIFNQQ